MPTITERPRKWLRLDKAYAHAGGLATFIEGRLMDGGRVPHEIIQDINRTLAVLGEEPMTAKTLYGWIRRWRASEKPEQELIAQ